MSKLVAGAIATASLRYHANNSQEVDADAPVHGFSCCLCAERAPHSKNKRSESDSKSEL
jgi:hypothetical protein